MLTVPGLPDPFAVATINGEQTKTTTVSKRTLNPYWNETFDLYAHHTYPDYKTIGQADTKGNSRANEASILAVQVFDQKKFKKKDQGFLGVINIRVGDVMPDLGPDSDGMAQNALSRRQIFQVPNANSQLT